MTKGFKEGLRGHGQDYAQGWGNLGNWSFVRDSAIRRRISDGSFSRGDLPTGYVVGGRGIMDMLLVVCCGRFLRFCD